MGFSLEVFIKELEQALANKDQKAKKTIKELERIISEGKAYAKKCGQLS